LAVNLLETHNQHRSVRFGQDGRPYLDSILGRDGEEQAVECGVMQLAKGEAVRHDRETMRIGICRDASCVEELGVVQPA
jgi:hypothetical protein